MKFAIKRLEYFIATLVKYPLVFVVLTSLLVAISYYDLGNTGYWLLVILCGLLVIFSSFKNTCIYLFVIALTFLQIQRFESLDANHISNFSNKTVEVYGKVEAYPFTKGQSQLFVFKPTLLVDGDLSEVKISGGKIRVKVSKYQDINMGDVLLMKGIILEPENIEEFDYRAYLKTTDIWATMSPFETTLISRVTSPIAELRNRLIQTARKNFPEPHAGLLLGMLIGTREEFADNFDVHLSRSGTTHIIAVSGYNVTVLVMLLLSFAGTFHRKHILLVAFLVLGVFITIVGTDNLPALRATIMGYAMLIGLLIGRKGAVFSSLALAVAIMLLQNPYVYKSLSFQLSFVSTLGLVFLQEPVAKIVPKFFGESLSEELSVTLAATIATFPIIFTNFAKVNPWAPLANILVGPVVPIIMLVGALYLLLVSLIPGLSNNIAIFVWLPLEYMIRAVTIVSSIPSAEINIDSEYNLLFTIAIVATCLIFIFEKSYRAKPSYE